MHTFLFTALEECSAPVYSADVKIMLHSIESSKMIGVTGELQVNETHCGKNYTLEKNCILRQLSSNSTICITDTIVLFNLNDIFIIFGSRVA